MLGLDPADLRIVCPWVGGGFGPKAAGYIEHVVAGKAALALNRPVKWAETRSESMVSLVHGRDYVMTGKLGVTKDGKIVGLDGDVVAAAGAYPAIGAILPMLTQMMSVGVYEVPKVRFKTVTVMTNNTTVGAYRGAGRPEATQLIERVLDVAADKIGMDPAEIRRVNFIQPGTFPLTTPTGANYDSGEYEQALDAALKASGYTELRAEQAEAACRRRHQAARHRCVGLRRGHRTGRPARRVRRGRGARRRVGQRVRRHQRARPGAPHRLRDAGQRGARHPDGQDLAGQLRHRDGASRRRHAGFALAADRGQRRSTSPPTRCSTAPRRSPPICWRRRPTTSSSARAGCTSPACRPAARRGPIWPSRRSDAAKLPDDVEPGILRHELDFDGTDSTFPFGAHVSVVEVDTETGGVTMLRHVAVDDCGRILNPMLVAGQQHGGIAQGAAQALYEWVQYDSDGNPITSNLMDYAIPSAAELCSFETSNTQTDSPRNPLGAKGIGESGTIGSTPAIQNAVVDAVSHLGVVHIDMPCTAERVWSAIQAASPN